MEDGNDNSTHTLEATHEGPEHEKIDHSLAVISVSEVSRCMITFLCGSNLEKQKTKHTVINYTVVQQKDVEVKEVPFWQGL